MTEELNWVLPKNDSSLVVRAGLEPATPNHSTTLPPLRLFALYYSLAELEKVFPQRFKKDRECLNSTWSARYNLKEACSINFKNPGFLYF